MSSRPPDADAPRPVRCVEAFLASDLVDRGNGLLVAFSGGADSTALLACLTTAAARRGLLVHAAHLDHGQDADSRRRADRARRIARDLGLELHLRRRPVAANRGRHESPESAARRIRYEFLETLRLELGARWTLTAHHREDQVETILLRLLCGSGLEGLGGIRPVHGRVVRPLLDCRREDLVRFARRYRPVVDPGNFDLARPRNLVRHLILPALREAEPGLEARLLALSSLVPPVRDRIVALLEPVLECRRDPWGLTVAREALRALPEPLWRHALALCHRRAGAPLPPSEAQARDLRRQCLAPGRVGCDLAGELRWESDGDRVRLTRPTPPAPRFAYTLAVPGEIDIPEVGVRFRLRRGSAAGWMFELSPRRAGLTLSLEDGDRVTIRNRRPGDRIRPFGSVGSRRLKDLLIDRRVPRRSRDRLPLLLVEERLVWVPGVTLDDACGVAPGDRVWIAEIEPLADVTDRQESCIKFASGHAL